MDSKILENQALQADMLFFDPPDKLIQLNNPFPKVIPTDLKPPFDDLLEIVSTDIEPTVKVFQNGDVRFRFHAPEAKTVEVAGLGGGFPLDRHAMVQSDDGWWSLTLPGIVPGFHYYEFFVDGNRLVNPNAQCGYGCFHVVNYFDLPTDQDDFWMLKDVPHGDVRMEYYFSSVTGRAKCAWIYTPPEYDCETCRYPVLYIQHSEGENETGWVWQGRLNLIADNLIAAGKCQKLIIVMTTGYAFKAGEKPSFFPGGFDAELTGDCIPTIDSKFRTIPDNRHRAVAGASMGSVQALYTALKHRDLFGSVGVFSGGIVNRRADIDCVNYLADIAKINPEFDLFYVSGGDRGFLEHTTPLLSELRTNGVKIVDSYRPGYHAWDIWRFSAYEFLQKLFMGVIS